MAGGSPSAGPSPEVCEVSFFETAPTGSAAVSAEIVNGIVASAGFDAAPDSPEK